MKYECLALVYTTQTVSQCQMFSSVLWHCWLGDSKNTQLANTSASYLQKFSFGRSEGRI